ncbi:hypothetical protein O181_064328 [Austropuccinia psidii MF-1]|uniref:Transmembrane protein 188 n=1 Tax=Austropuccinia psidii MF-1 TaxID=1389203 RepID=A0A9Q3EMT5_9BASI|nr:hypothetical protein [Austropuccinia psidii MF-1]
MLSNITPPANRQTFKDILVFEERLKQNSQRLQRQRLKYEAFLLTILIVSFILAYKTFISISPYKLIHYLYLALFLVSVTTLILFFVTGMYTDQIAYAYKFIPQTNRALRPFNMFLATPQPQPLISSKLIKPSLLYSKSSNHSIINSYSTISNSSANPSLIDSNHLNLNTNGQLLFSSKVDSHFIESYQKYRHQWEQLCKKKTT